MSRHPELYQWIDTVVMRFPSLSKPQALGLALWSFGMILARSCSLTAVTDLLAPLLGQSFNTMRERLRDTYREADAKAGKQRAELDIALCWAPWLAWILDGWEGQQLAIAMDATSLGDRFVVLVICIVYRGCAESSGSRKLARKIGVRSHIPTKPNRPFQRNRYSLSIMAACLANGSALNFRIKC